MKFNKFGLTVLLCSTVYGFNAMSFETAARNAILMDYDTGEYLFTKNMDESVPPASMSMAQRRRSYRRLYNVSFHRR